MDLFIDIWLGSDVSQAGALPLSPPSLFSLRSDREQGWPDWTPKRIICRCYRYRFRLFIRSELQVSICSFTGTLLMCASPPSADHRLPERWPRLGESPPEDFELGGMKINSHCFQMSDHCRRIPESGFCLFQYKLLQQPREEKRRKMWNRGFYMSLGT